MSKFTIKVYSCTEFAIPLNDSHIYSYFVCVPYKNIAGVLKDWRRINPREPSLNAHSKPISGMLDTITTNPKLFVINNRGLTITAQSLQYSNLRKEIVLDLTNEQLHGLLDGGHTYMFLEKLYSNDVDLSDIMLKLEIIVGFNNINEVINIADARNTSTQVKEQSKQNARGYYDLIKETIKDKPYANKISYKEIQYSDSIELKSKTTDAKQNYALLGGRCDISVIEILRLLACFNIYLFPDGQHNPFAMFNTVNKVLSYYSDDSKRITMDKITPLLPEIIDLYNFILLETPKLYEGRSVYNHKYHQGSRGGFQFSKVKTVKKLNKPTQLPLGNSGDKVTHKIPNSIWLPVLAAHRVLIGVNSKGECYWKCNPVEFFKLYGEDLIREICAQANEYGDNNRLGKNRTTWRVLYDICVGNFEKISK